MRVVVARVVLVLGLPVATPFVVGCKVYEPWKDLPGKHPWCQPDRIARLQDRGFDYFPLPAGGIQERWVLADGETYNVYELVDRVAEYLKCSGATDAWPVARVVDGRGEKRAPWAFFIVSVRPIIVLMAPPSCEKNYESTWTSQEMLSHHGWLLRDTLNFLNSSTDFPQHYPIWWFSPDLNRPPAELLHEGQTTARIPLPDGGINVNADHGRWWVTRQ